MEQQITFTPNDILKAYKEFGDKAFIADVKLSKENTKGNVTYIPLKCMYHKNGKWTPEKINIITKKIESGAVKIPSDRASFGHKVYVTYRGDSTFDLNGVTQEYGKAKILLNTQITRIINELLKGGKITPENPKISSTIQFERTPDKKKKNMKEKLENPIIRVEIPWDIPSGAKEVSPTALPLVRIYDVTKKVVGGKPKYGLATVIDDETGTETKLNHGNVHTFIKSKSKISGVENMDTILLHKFGISVPAKYQGSVFIKSGNGHELDVEAMFANIDLDDDEEATVPTKAIKDDDEDEKDDFDDLSD